KAVCSHHKLIISRLTLFTCVWNYSSSMAKKASFPQSGPALHCCAMFLLLLLLIFDLLASAQAANCDYSSIRKPPRFGKRFGSELMQRMKQAHPCLTALERRSDLAPSLTDYLERTQAEKQQEMVVAAPNYIESEQEDKLPTGLLLKVYSILRRKNAD